MKKMLFGMILGVIFGIATTLSASVYADEIKSEIKNLTGLQVQGTFPVKLQGSQLQTNAIVVDETSYLPVRTIGELLNVNVSFIDNEVVLEAKDESSVNVEKLKEYEKKMTDDKLSQWEKDRQEGIKQQKALEEQQKALQAQIKAKEDAAEAERQRINKLFEEENPHDQPQSGK